MAFCLRDCKQVQNKRSESHLTGDKIFKHWLPLQKEPGIPRNSGVKFLAFLASLHIRKSQEKARKSQECPGPPGFPGTPGKARRSWKENFLAFRAFPYVQKSPELLTRMIAGTPWLFLDSGVSWKAWKSQEKPGKIKRKFSRFPGFSLCAKKSPELLTGMISGTSWFFLDSGVSWKAWKSLEKPRENLPHGTLGSSLIAGLPWKPGKAERRFTTLHSWLLLDCGVP